jgi:hypothetical protein
MDYIVSCIISNSINRQLQSHDPSVRSCDILITSATRVKDIGIDLDGTIIHTPGRSREKELPLKATV